MDDATNELKTSVSDGKSAIAAAVTDKGVNTAASDSFSTMAGNIRSILGMGSLPGTILSELYTNYGMAGTKELDLSAYNNYSNFLFIASAGAHGSNIGGTGFGLWIINNLVINQLIRYSGANSASVSLSISGSIISVCFSGGRTTSLSYNLFGL